MISDIDPIMDDDSTLEVNTNVNAICNLTPDEIEGYRNCDNEEDDGNESDKWERPERNAFDLFGDFDDEENL